MKSGQASYMRDVRGARWSSMLLRAAGLAFFVALLCATCALGVPAASAQSLTVQSPENPVDCAGVQFGPNRFDSNRPRKCCLPGQMVCGKCDYTKTACENVFGCDTPATPDRTGTCCFSHQKTCNRCYYSMVGCEPSHGCDTSVTNKGCGCGNETSCFGCDGVANSGKKVMCGTCGGTMGGCGRCEGCRSCSFNWGCQDPGTGCNPAYSDPSKYCPGNGSIGHGSKITKIIHGSIRRGTGYLWSTNVNNELLSCFTHSFQTYTCNDGTLQ